MALSIIERWVARLQSLLAPTSASTIIGAVLADSPTPVSRPMHEMAFVWANERHDALSKEAPARTTAVTPIPTVANFVARHNITMTFQQVRANPLWQGEVIEGHRHFRCVLRLGGRMMLMYYSTPDETPTAADVLDAMSAEVETLSDPGAVAKLPVTLQDAIQEQFRKLIGFLGEERLAELMQST